MPSVHELGRVANRRILGPVRRRLRSPFDPGTEPRIIVHCSHHKVGTVWFHSVLDAIAGSYGLRVRIVRHPPVRLDDADIAFFEDARFFDPGAVPGAYRGSHLIRDPRDMVVSGYYYHLRAHEPWLRDASDRWGPNGYQAHLRSLDPHNGLLTEIRRMADLELRDIGAWDYDQREFLELRYEDVIADERAWFERLFRHYGFSDTGVRLGVAAANRLSLRRLDRSRAPRDRRAMHVRSGHVRSGHVRSGRPGDWRLHFTDEHVELFQELTGDLLVRLGYETSPHWASEVPRRK